MLIHNSQLTIHNSNSYVKNKRFTCQRRWQGDIKSTFLIGLKMGFFCLGCCWLLMSLAFVGGLMNIGLMLLMTIVMISEKLPKFGQYVTFPLSVLLLISALLIAIAELI